MTSLRDIVGYGHIDNKMMHPHCNPGMEIILTEQGELTWAVEGRPEQVGPGYVFFTLPWQAHGSHDFREPKYKIYWLLFSLPGCGSEPQRTIRFPAALGFSKTETARLSRIFTTAQRHAWPATPLIKQSFSELIRRMEQPSAENRQIAICLWKILLLELSEIVRDQKNDGVWHSPTVRKVEKLIRQLQKLDRHWTLDEMAAVCGIKRTHLSNIFHDLTGYAPLQYVALLRYEKACRLLRETDRSVTEIAFECGYNSSQYFSEAFHKISHLTPTKYREIAPDIETIIKTTWGNPEKRTIEDEHRRFEKLWGRHDIDIDKGPVA